jgi:2-dehydropantoate 2-reductase
MPANNDPRIQFLFFGVGAIGTYIGGSLLLAGQNVTFIERPEVAAGIRERGLRLKIGTNENHIENPVIVHSVDEALQRGKYDLAVQAVKSYDTPSVINDIKPYIDQFPPILCFQNGVENEPALEEALGLGKVIAGTVTSAVGRRDAGDIILEKRRGVGAALGHPLVPELISVLNQADLNAHSYSNAASMKWSKMLTNLMANASSAILDMTPADIFEDPVLYHLEIRQMREALDVMKAYGIPVTNLPGTPVIGLSWLIRYFNPAFSQPLLKRAMGKGRGAKMPSFHIDLHSGRSKSEVDYLNGAVIRFGKQKGIPTPVNELFTRTLLGLTNGDIPLDTFAKKPGKLVTLLVES